MSIDVNFFFNLNNQFENTQDFIEKLNETIGLNLKKNNEDNFGEGVLKGF